MIALFVMISFSIDASAESGAITHGEGNATYSQVYDMMEEYFLRGDFENAFKAAEFVYKESPRYSNISSYYQYLLAIQVFIP